MNFWVKKNIKTFNLAFLKLHLIVTENSAALFFFKSGSQNHFQGTITDIR